MSETEWLNHLALHKGWDAADLCATLVKAEPCHRRAVVMVANLMAAWYIHVNNKVYSS